MQVQDGFLDLLHFTVFSSCSNLSFLVKISFFVGPPPGYGQASRGQYEQQQQQQQQQYGQGQGQQRQQPPPGSGGHFGDGPPQAQGYSQGPRQPRGPPPGYGQPSVLFDASYM